MTSADELFDHARAMLVQAGAADEAVLRRAVSTTYYALFHLLAQAGSSVVAGGAGQTAAKVARAFNHSSMYKVCVAYQSCAAGKSPSLLQGVVSAAPDTRLVAVADAFTDLQAARHRADYDLEATFEAHGAGRLLVVGLRARHDFNAIRELPETRTFLVALLLADRWSRIG